MTENLTLNNEHSLQTLVRAITLSQGQFSLILLRCNYADLRRRISQRLHQISPINIHEITIPASVKTLYTSITEELGNIQPPALMVFGLENVKDIDTMLTAANRVREEFSSNFPFPILLWVNDLVLQKFIRLATDLENWSTIIEFENSTHELIAFIQQQTEAIFTSKIILNLQTCWELEKAIQDLQSRGEVLTPSLQANLEYVRGLHNYLADKIDVAVEHYQQSLSFWRQSEDLERQGILLAHIALAYERQAVIDKTENQRYWQLAQEYLQQALDILEQGEYLNLVAQYINKLGEILQNLNAWAELESLANQSLLLQQEYGTPLQLAQAYGFLAEVAVENSRWNEANQFAQQALHILDNTPDVQLYIYSWYRLILAQSQQGLGDITAAIHSLEMARESANHQYNPQLYISILEKLRLLYFEQGEYLKAFNFKQEQLQIEQQYGFRAFVGASYLNPQRKVINPYVAQVMEDPSPNLSHQLLQRGEPPQRTGSPARREALNIPPSLTGKGVRGLGQLDNTGTVAQEIAASGREIDVNRLRVRISENQHKLTIIHGQSGVGKSSILQAGLIPALQQQPIGERDALPILIRVYTEWVTVLGRRLSEEFEAVREKKLTVNLDSVTAIQSQLQNNEDRNLLTVLIFDQFEEFFFVYPDKAQRLEFYEFLRVCLDIPFVKIVLSLREDYLHYLLELERLFNLSAVNNNILDKGIRYYLGNFSPDDTKKVIQSLTENTQFYLEPRLVEQLVSDLAGELGEVRPIELQIVGAQLQTDCITTLEQYQQVGTKEKLVEQFLEDVIQDCGAGNEQVARLVLYLLTDENGTRPLKTRAELAEDLVAEADKLNLVLDIVVKSGLVLLLPGSPADRYQLVHDYLVAFIRQQQGNEILAELAREREQRQLTEEELKRVEQKNKILADAQTEADQKIKQGRNRLLLSSGLSICLLVVTSWYAFSLFQQAKSAKIKQQESEIKFTVAQQGLQEVNQEKQQTETKLANNLKKAQALENKSKDLEKNFLVALKNKQYAEAKFKVAQADTKKASQNLADAKVDLDKVNKEAANLQQKNADAEARIKTVTEKVKTAEANVQQAKKQQDDAEAKARQANETLKQAETKLANAKKETETALAAQAEAKKGTELERAGLNALEQFGFAQLEALVAVMHSAKELKGLVKDGRPLEKYPAISPIFALDSILNKITERNQFKGHQGEVYSVSFSPDGKTIATASLDKTARLWSLDGKLLQEFKGHQGQVYSVSFSPDGKIVATASLDKTARLWSLDGKLLQEFKGHQGGVVSVSFSPDGKIVATASLDKTARLWNLDGKLLQEFKGHQGGVYDVSFSPDGKTIATASQDKTARLWSLDGKLLQEFKGHQDGVYDVSFSPDGKTIATASLDKTARLWSLDGKLLQEFKGHQDGVVSVSFSPDGKTIATASGDTTVRLWNLNGEFLEVFQGYRFNVYSVSFSPDGKTIAAALGDSTVRLWNFDGKLLQEFKGHQGQVVSVSFSPDGKTIATASQDKTARLWSLDGKLLQEFKGHQDGVYDISFSPDGKTIATASLDKTARLWNLDGKLLQEFKGHQDGVVSVSFSPDGKTIATASGDTTVRLWNLNGEFLEVFQGYRFNVYSVSFSPDGKTIAAALGDSTVRLWNFDGKLLQEFKGHQGQVVSVSFSPDGKTIATASQDKTARLWSLDGKLLQEFKGHQDGVYDISFSPDGKIVATASLDKTARLWSLDGKLLQEFKGHQGGVVSVSFSPDGKIVATASLDKTARLWNLDGKLLQEFKGHQDGVYDVSFSPDGKTIATASQDKTARLWSLDGKLLQEFKGHQGLIYSVSFSPDGKTIATASLDKTARLWNLDGKLLQEFKGHQVSANSVSFSPDGQTIATASSEGTARLWSLNGQLLQEFEGHLGSVYDVSFSPDGQTIATASLDETARLWPVHSLDQLLVRGCEWLQYYVKNPIATEEDRRLCNDIK
ncbi:hypothetical protein IQ244_18110 [Nostoc sp. LEGE 06077]|uniref:nSTAND1 domain-containing NTPase n=1 Tax=Nostoc sp. LEGE 06077 TaxID=915325 RepID=UPI001880AD34|nr:hypothetical protein [Nostoc sp. LEGE 06077]MBE9208409.1 hypothetical protein [Nostoc sp. LEGE 06077]